MSEATPLDLAHAAMQDAPEMVESRLAFFSRVADTELFLLLEQEPVGDDIAPELFMVGDVRYLLAFDREDRLTDFTGRPAPYVAVSGRTLAEMLAGQGIGAGLNLGAASEELLPPETIDWLAGVLATRPARAEARPVAVAAPSGLAQPLLSALDAKLAAAGGLAREACLAAVTWEGGAQGHLLAFFDAQPGAEDALARAAAEALTFSGLEAGALDVAFLSATDPAAERLRRTGLRFEIAAARSPA